MSGPYWDVAWNPVTGCTPCSPGCEHCWAERIAARHLPVTRCPLCDGSGRIWELSRTEECPTCHGSGNAGFTPTFHPDRLDQPLHWRKPRAVFVGSMTDLFHEAFTDEQRDDVFSMILASAVLTGPRHFYFVLTKRQREMQRYLSAEPVELLKRWSHAGDGLIHVANDLWFHEVVESATCRDWDDNGFNRNNSEYKPWGYIDKLWPLPNVATGVSVWDQESADRAIPALLATPAAVRFVSYEPALAGVDFRRWTGNLRIPLPDGSDFAWRHPKREPHPLLDWVIVGGESGPGARPMDPHWALDVWQQCREAHVPFFFTQWGSATDKQVLDQLRTLASEMAGTRELPWEAK